MVDFTDVLTVGGTDDLTAAGFLGRDCAFPVMRIEKTFTQDDVLAQMPVYFGYWNDDTPLPVLLGQTIDVDTSVITDDCDTATVSGDLTEGELIAPNMGKVKLSTETLQVDKLIPAFCRTRNVLPAQRRTLLNSDGSINLGNPYAVNFARFVFSLLAKPLAAILSDRVLRGDASEVFGIDGLYTQLENGWENGSPTVPDGLNKAIAIDWNSVTGGSGTASPDAKIGASKTLSLWGDTLSLPQNYNLAMLLNDFYIPAVTKHWGMVDVWEIHVPPGMAQCIVNSAACIQPCGTDVTVFDTGLRQRYADLSRQNVVELYPSGKRLVILESPHVAAGEMWIGPRSIGGNPTYGTFFRDMDELFAAIGMLGNTYGQQNGIPMDDEPLLIDPIQTLPFEARAVRQDVSKVPQSIDCVTAGVMAIVGVLAFERHLWLHLTNISCATWIEAMQSGVTIDGTAVETHS